MKKDKVTLRRLTALYVRGIRTISRYLPKLFPAIAAHSVVSAATPYITVWLAAQVINELAGNREPRTLWMWVAITVLGGALLALSNGLLSRWKSDQWTMLHLRCEEMLTDKMLEMDFAQADDQETRDLLNRVRHNRRTMGFGLHQIPSHYEALLSSATGIISALALTVSLFSSPVPETASGLLWLNNPWCAAAMLLLLIAVTWASAWLAKTSQAIQNAMYDPVFHCNRVYGVLCRVAFEPSQAADVRLYRQERILDSYFSRLTEAFVGKDGVIRRMNKGAPGLLWSFSTAMSAVSVGVVYVFAALKASGGAFGIGSVTQYVGALATLSRNLGTLMSTVMQMRMNASRLETVFEFLDIPRRMYQGTLTTEKRDDRRYEVEFRNVSFAYPSRQDKALQNVSVKFRVGSRLAVVGENGSGKTTFIKLLCRLYDPDEGKILLNGIDIRKYKYDNYIGIFSVVFQDFKLVSQSLGSNVAGRAEYDRDRVTTCLEEAGFGERLCELENGLDTQLYRHFSEEGVSVSGGEAQKIAIARALFKNAPFIILDEPTASLDPIAEAEIYASFDRIVGDKTAIYISHRLSSCRFCDEILVFDKGAIVQRGTHEELVQDTTGKYYELWNAQAQYYENT